MPKSTHEAVEQQRRLARFTQIQPLGAPPQWIAGADISYNRYEDQAYSAWVMLDAKSLEPVAQATHSGIMRFPYIPGLLSFREIPVLMEGWNELLTTLRRKNLPLPDVILVDGHGIAHPRRIGIATHLGLTLDLPTIGCAKSLLVGQISEEIEPQAGSLSPLVHRGEIIGAALRTKARVQPIYVSPGHRVTLAESLEISYRACRGYRLPEPTRLAHILANQARVAGTEAGLSKNSKTLSSA